MPTTAQWLCDVSLTIIKSGSVVSHVHSALKILDFYVGTSNFQRECGIEEFRLIVDAVVNLPICSHSLLYLRVIAIVAEKGRAPERGLYEP